MARARALLGELLSNRGMFEEAARHLTLAVEVFPPAFLELTVVKRMTETDRALVDRMHVLADGPGLEVLPRSTFNSALARPTTISAITPRRCGITKRQTGCGR